MGFIGSIIHEAFYQPIYNLVVFIYNFTPGPNLGWTIVALALLVRFIFLYFTLRGYQTDKVYYELTPVVTQIENDTSLNNRQKRNKIVELLRENNVNPYSEIIGVLGQFFFLVIFYFVLQTGIKPTGFQDIYPFVSHPISINTEFFGYDLAKPDLALSLFAAILLFIELYWENMTKPSLAKMKFSERWYPLLLSGFTFVLLYLLPSAKAVFVFVSVLFSILVKLIVTSVRDSSK